MEKMNARDIALACGVYYYITYIYIASAYT